MDTTKSLALYPLSQDNIKKIMACSDPESRNALRYTCHDLLKIKTENLIHHSPLILNRKDHIFYMVHAAQTNDELLMKNLLNNARLCDRKDALDLMLNFITKKTEDPLEKIIIATLKAGQKNTKDSSVKIVDNCIKKYRRELFNDIHLFFPQLMSLYKAEKTIINKYISNAYTSYIKPEMITKLKITPLQTAAQLGNITMIEILLLNDHEKYINDADTEGFTPLYLAGDINVVKMLLQCKNIQPNKRTKNGITPLYKAVCKQNQPLIDLFLTHPDFIINEEDENQLTPLHVAAQKGSIVAFEFFFKHTEGKVRNTTKPIHYAASFGHSNIVDIILKNDSSQLNIKNNVGETPLLLASASNQFFVVDLLINSGAIVDLADQNNITPLWIASQNGCDNIVSLLIAGKANVNSLSNDKVTPLWKAVQNGRTKIVLWLLKNGAFVNHADEDSITPLMMASQKGYLTIVKYLLKYGANPTLQTSDGVTALDVAYDDEIEELLEQALKQL